MKVELYSSILYNLEVLYSKVFDKENIVFNCVDKYNKFSFSSFKDNVMHYVVQRANILGGLFFETLFMDFLKEDSNEDGTKRYEILDECTKKVIEQDCFNVITLQEEVLNRDVDLFFKDIKNNTFYYMELRSKCNQDSSKKLMTIRHFEDTYKTLKSKYDNVIGKIVFIEEDKVTSYYSMDKSCLMTGDEFCKYFLNCGIEDVYKVIESCKNRLNIDDKFKWTAKFIEEFEYLAKKYDVDIARNKLLGNAQLKSPINFSI